MAFPQSHPERRAVAAGGRIFRRRHLYGPCQSQRPISSAALAKAPPPPPPAPPPSPQHPAHGVDALALLLQIGVDVEVEGGADAGVAEEDADGLVVAFALDAAGGEAVAEAMEAHAGETQPEQETGEVAAVAAGLRGRGGVGEHVEVAPHDLLQGTYQRQQVAGHGDLPDGASGLGPVDNELRILFPPVRHIDALDGLAHAYDSGGHVDVVPLQGAQLADAQAGVQADKDAQVEEAEVLPHVGHQLPLVGDAEHRHVRPPAVGGEDDVQRVHLHQSVLVGVTQYHLQDHEDLTYGLPAEPRRKLAVHQPLHVLFPDVRQLSQLRDQMAPDEDAVGGVT